MMDLFSEKPRPVVDVSRLGAFGSIIITETEGKIAFADGDVILSTEQAFALLRQQKAVST